MNTRNRHMTLALSAGVALSVAGPLAAVAGTGWLDWLGWSPFVVFLAGFGFFAANENTAWGRGLMAGVLVGLFGLVVIGAGVCINTGS